MLMASVFRLSMPRALCGVALLVSLSACESTVVGPAEFQPPAAAVSFAADVQPLLASGCGGSACHVNGTTSGVDLSSHATVRASVGNQYGEAIVIPGDAAASPLIDKLEASPRFGSRMPLGRSPLTADQVSAVRAWIDAGALDN